MVPATRRRRSTADCWRVSVSLKSKYVGQHKCLQTPIRHLGRDVVMEGSSRREHCLAKVERRADQFRRDDYMDPCAHINPGIRPSRNSSDVLASYSHDSVISCLMLAKGGSNDDCSRRTTSLIPYLPHCAARAYAGIRLQEKKAMRPLC